jgi:hypothetical protein
MPWATVAKALFQFEKCIQEWESSVRDGCRMGTAIFIVVIYSGDAGKGEGGIPWM